MQTVDLPIFFTLRGVKIVQRVHLTKRHYFEYRNVPFNTKRLYVKKKNSVSFETSNKWRSKRFTEKIDSLKEENTQRWENEEREGSEEKKKKEKGQRFLQWVW